MNLRSIKEQSRLLLDPSLRPVPTDEYGMSLTLGHGVL
jgi:hypothetical protein